MAKRVHKPRGEQLMHELDGGRLVGVMVGRWWGGGRFNELGFIREGHLKLT